jgi:hypothetical protein
MTLSINNTTELLTFIKKDSVTVDQAIKVVRSALNVNVLFKYNKAELIAETQYYVDNYCQNSKTERPLFLQRNLPDICNRNKAVSLINNKSHI